jgi:hypothetical protein
MNLMSGAIPKNKEAYDYMKSYSHTKTWKRKIIQPAGDNRASRQPGAIF